jgi:hypothetical protein
MEPSRHTFEKYLNIKFHTSPSNPSVGPSKLIDEQTGRGK